MVHAGPMGHGGSRLFIVAGQHDHLDAHILKLLDGPGRVFLDDIGHGHESQKFSFFFKEEGRLPFFGKGFRPILEFFYGCEGGNIGSGTAVEFLSSQISFQPMARQDFEISQGKGFH